jgi:DnaK suppressor protein
MGYPMEKYDNSHAQRFGQLLDQREAELRALLRSSGYSLSIAGEDAAHEVMDFKDVATEQNQDTIDAAKAEHAAFELEQVLAARRRMLDHSYGQCLDCGNAIDLLRLASLPAAPLCTACQSKLERKTPLTKLRPTPHLNS